jgi:hypothetical protein
MNRAGVPLTALLFLFLLPTAIGAVPTLFAVEADSIGTGTLEATLQGAWLEDASLAGEPVAASSYKGELTLHQRTYDVYAGQVGITPVNNTATSTALNDAIIEEFHLGAEARILVIGREATLRTTPDGTVFTQNLLDFTFPRRASPGEPWRIQSAQTLQVTAGNGSYMIAGDFELVVWDATFTVRNATANRTIETGTWDETPPGLPTGGPISRHIQREAFMRVNGTLTLPRNSALKVYIDQAFLDLQTGQLQARSPSGINPVDGQSIAQGTQRLALQAPLSTQIAAATDSIGIAFLKPPRQAELDGAVVVAPEGSSNWWAWSLLAVVAVPVILAAGTKLRRSQQTRRLDALMRNRDVGAAGRLAHAMRQRRSHDQVALVAETIALVHGHDYDAARQLLTEATWSEPLRPMRDYLRACVEVGLGHPKQAVTFLAACLRSAPELQAEAQANPLLHGIVAEARRTNA